MIAVRVFAGGDFVCTKRINLSENLLQTGESVVSIWRPINHMTPGNGDWRPGILTICATTGAVIH